MRLTGVLLCLLLIAGCSSPRVETYDDSRLVERIDQLSRECMDLNGDLTALRSQLSTDTTYLNSQLSILQANYDLLWDSYNSLFDYIIAQNQGTMMEVNPEGGEPK